MRRRCCTPLNACILLFLSHNGGWGHIWCSRLPSWQGSQLCPAYAPEQAPTVEGLGGEQGHAVPAGRGCPAGGAAPSTFPGRHQGGHGGAALAAGWTAPLRLARGDPRLVLLLAACRLLLLLLLQGPIGRAGCPAAAVLAVGLRLRRRELRRGRVLARPRTAAAAATVDGRDGPRLDLAAAFRPAGRGGGGGQGSPQHGRITGTLPTRALMVSLPG